MVMRVGILGLGFMGKLHFDLYSRIKNAKVVAISDIDAKKLRGDFPSIIGNLDDSGVRPDLSRIRAYNRVEQLFAKADVDIIDINLPTYLHAEMTIRALKAGKHVICEKPMALTSSQCRKMVEAARRAKRKLFVGHCIRFWPEYVKAREIVRSGKFGKVISAVFTRLCAWPQWSHQNWMQDQAKSGACAMDLHIHDADFILYLFGKPKSLASHGSGFRKGQLDHIVTTYDYGDNLLVTAEGAWDYVGDFPFSMTFRIAMEKAMLSFQADGLLLYPARGKARKLRVKTGGGHEHELRHFIDCIVENRNSKVISPESSMESVKLVETEIKSALKGRTIRIKP